jgi:hypothetical protein
VSRPDGNAAGCLDDPPRRDREETLRSDASSQRGINHDAALSALAALVGEAHHERQSNVESPDVLLVEPPHLPPNALATNRHGLVGHHL